ncbi:MAG: hypothetical protein ACOC6S_02180 [Chloroflexota bacterium]
MERTGIFFHYQEGERLRDFPQALGEVLTQDNVFLYDALYPSKPSSPFDLEPVPLDLMRAVHSEGMIERVRKAGAFEGALFSASSTVAAATRIWNDEVDNAFVFTGYGDHHAGRNSFGGGCYFNGAAMAIRMLQREHRAERFAILDTDAHHGDGTWDIFAQDSQVLYACLCRGSNQDVNNKVNIHVDHEISDKAYVDLIRERFIPRVKDFQPEIIFWNWGYDGTRGDYGSLGLTPEVHASIAHELKLLSEKVCKGRLVVVLCGGSRRDLARFLIPQIIQVLVS